MTWQHLQQGGAELGWEFYGPVLIFVLLTGLGVPVWATIGEPVDVPRKAEDAEALRDTVQSLTDKAAAARDEAPYPGIRRYRPPSE